MPFEFHSQLGQGLPHSSEVADMCFFNVVEKSLICNGPHFGVVSYVRYRDDILMVCDESQKYKGVSTFVGLLLNACPWWQIN